MANPALFLDQEVPAPRNVHIMHTIDPELDPESDPEPDPELDPELDPESGCAQKHCRLSFLCIKDSSGQARMLKPRRRNT